jgi:small-conductance mechanosensitive channel
LKLIKIILNFVRKVKIFNKSRYSRNRQNVRITFYFSIYFNILIIYTVFSLFYNLALFLTYNWWFYLTFILYFLVSNVIKIYKK